MEHDWVVIAKADNIGGPNLYECSKCKKQWLIQIPPLTEGCKGKK
jgi:hypothetical protein